MCVEIVCVCVHPSVRALETFLGARMSNSYHCLLSTHFHRSIDLITQKVGKKNTIILIFHLYCESIVSKFDRYFGLINSFRNS